MARNRNISIKIDREVADQIIANLPQRANKFLQLMSEDMVIEIKRGFSTGGNFRQWRSKRGVGIYHWSAPPGKPPNNDTYNLMMSIKNLKVNNFSWRIEDGVHYGKFQELGTSSGGYGGNGHAARPFVRPVFKKYKQGANLSHYAREAGLMLP